MNSRLSQIFLWIGLTLLLAQLACGMGSEAVAPESPEEPFYPEPAPTQEEFIPASTLAAPQPALAESRLLTLEFPPRIRVGDSELIRLTLEVDQNGNLTATAETAGNITHGEVIQIPNIYDTHYVNVETRLDLAGMQIDPPGAMSESLRPGRKLNFYWSIRTDEVGLYRGTVWFYLLFTPRDGGLEERVALSAQKIEIEAVNFFGLGARSARWLGGIGATISALLGLPFIEDLLKHLWRRFSPTSGANLTV